MRILETEELLIKPVEDEDIKPLMDLRWDADVMEYLLHDPIGMREQKLWYESSKNDKVFSVFLKEPKGLTLIGTTGLYNINMRHQTAVLKLRIAPQVQGRGLGYKIFVLILDYAFDTLNLRKILSDNFSDNKRVAAMKEKLGFVKEGVLRKHYYHKGDFKDADVYNLLREDYKAVRSTFDK
jgi:RimJ/RimL family protein N-acetyltransferase